MRLLLVIGLFCSACLSIYSAESTPFQLARGSFTTDSGFQGLLARELVRQSVLIAAREELGLATRDESFGEPLSAGIPIFSIKVKLEGDFIPKAEPIPAKYFHTTAEGKDDAGLTGTYFNGKNFETQILQRKDTGINFDWGQNAPAPGVNPDLFSVRWKGFLELPNEGQYTFLFTTDDGGRLWLDGKQEINQWVDQAPTTLSLLHECKAGRIPFKMEYYDNSGNASADLKWVRGLPPNNSKNKLTITLQRDGKDVGEPMVAEIPWVGPSLYWGLIHGCEEWSRTEFPARLKAAGLQAVAREIPKEKPTPESIEAALQQPCLARQYQALRMLHPLTADPTDIRSLTQLAMGYSLLGWTVEAGPLASLECAQARALLYARRATQIAKPDSPNAALAALAQCFVYSTAGFPGWGERQFEAAKKAWGTTLLPEWSVLGEKYWLSDVKELHTRADPKLPWGAWSAAFETALISWRESTGTRERLLRDYIAKFPKSEGLYDGLTFTGGISNLHVSTVGRPETSRANLSAALNDIPGLTPALQKLAAKGTRDPLEYAELCEVQTELFKAATDDHREPSLGLFHSITAGDYFWQISRRANFISTEFSAGNKAVIDYLDGEEKLLSNFPLAALLKMYRHSIITEKEAALKELSGLEIQDLNQRIRRLLWNVERGLPERSPWSDASDAQAQQQTDFTSWSMSDAMRKAEPTQEYLWDWAAQLAPHSSFTDIKFIELRADRGPKMLEELEKRPDLPFSVMNALAKYYDQRKNSAKALAWREKLVAENGDLEQLSKLAWRYKRAGNEAKYFELMDKALQQPDGGLGHARLRTQLASVYRNKGDYAKAVTYAEAGAQSWAQWAMNEAVWAYEGTGEWDKAKQWARRISERYEHDAEMWYFQSMIYGSNDLAEAAKYAEEKIQKRSDGKLTGQDHSVLAWMSFEQKKKDKAIEHWQEVYKLFVSPIEPLALAVALDGKDQAAKRLEWLDLAVKNNAEYKSTSALAEIWRTALKANQVPVKEKVWDLILKTDSRWESPLVCFAAGQIYLQAGDKETAQRMFYTGMNWPTCDYRFKSACAFSLRDAGLPAELRKASPNYPPRDFANPKPEKPKKPAEEF